MKFVWLWTVLWNILPLSLTAQKYITINVNDIDGLAITCSIINSDQLAEKHLIQLQRKKNNMFETVISINRIGILWKDEVFKKRATANGSLEEGELRLFIDEVQCFTDFTEYRCYMEGILNPTSTQKNLPEINDTVTWSYSDTCTSIMPPKKRARRDDVATGGVPPPTPPTEVHNGKKGQKRTRKQAETDTVNVLSNLDYELLAKEIVNQQKAASEKQNIGEKVGQPPMVNSVEDTAPVVGEAIPAAATIPASAAATIPASALGTLLDNVFTASTAQKYITINVTDKDGLAIKCSIINSDQLAALHLIQLERASGSTFDKVITIWNNNSRSQIDWKDEDLKNRATANGSIEEEELRLFINRVQCFTDFTEYRCYMEGILNPTQNNVPEINDTVTWSYSDTCTSTSKPQTTTTEKPETTKRPGNAVTSTPQPRTTRASGNIGNADKDKRSSGTTLHISITGVETSQYTALLNALFWIPVWIIVKLNTDSA